MGMQDDHRGPLAGYFEMAEHSERSAAAVYFLSACTLLR
jgi:hypothetical protein